MPGVPALLCLSARTRLPPPVPTGPARPAPIVCILTPLLLLMTPLARASGRPKTDVVIMKNGDRFTCEIKSLEKGQLNIKPDYTNSTIALDWEKVDHVESKQGFVVSDPHGNIYSGKIQHDPKTKDLTIIGSDTTRLPNVEVVQVEELGEDFWKRMRGNIDFGTSFAQSNSQKILSLQGGLGYQSEKYIVSLNSNSQFTSQQQVNDTNETNIKTSLYKELRRSNWYYGGIANFISSTAQQIALRSTYGATLNKRLMFTNRSNLNAVGGLAFTTERDSEGAENSARNNAIDSALAINYSTFRFESITFDTAFWLYPSITSPGRVRFTLNQDVYYKFLGDFYIRMSFYDNYDNQPVVGAPSNNVGGSTTVGWSFH
ncbi:DUF481 domain-containing protein [Edaphobacter sp. HDX4]|uniref:DUF481 domain-containing protein n=1 Tax=Edaphobacter sp. HDX4 TaxID=2794064 RepID=UPI002FE53610